MGISEEMKEIIVNLITLIHSYSDCPIPADYGCSPVFIVLCNNKLLRLTNPVGDSQHFWLYI